MMKESIERVLGLEEEFREEMEAARKQGEAMMIDAKKNVQEMEEIYRLAVEEGKKKEREVLKRERDEYKKQRQQEAEKSIAKYREKLFGLREIVKKEIENRLWEE